eukprot:TRINITY_DN5382_c0_g1_i1.p1 TRINITY_DN5382_c0_g1~~TRINITY_DN5382_c0_g1_i1.p1  ORF type:complete len:352 (+),score=86.54 TRINITY_DN5382_c0_g1_i1:74-1057(+)
MEIEPFEIPQPAKKARYEQQFQFVTALCTKLGKSYAPYKYRALFIVALFVTVAVIPIAYHHRSTISVYIEYSNCGDKASIAMLLNFALMGRAATRGWAYSIVGTLLVGQFIHALSFGSIANLMNHGVNGLLVHLGWQCAVLLAFIVASFGYEADYRPYPIYDLLDWAGMTIGNVGTAIGETTAKWRKKKNTPLKGVSRSEQSNLFTSKPAETEVASDVSEESEEALKKKAEKQTNAQTTKKPTEAQTPKQTAKTPKKSTNKPKNPTDLQPPAVQTPKQSAKTPKKSTNAKTDAQTQTPKKFMKPADAQQPKEGAEATPLKSLKNKSQ